MHAIGKFVWHIGSHRRSAICSEHRTTI